MRYTWSRWAPYPVEHIADDTEWGQPICGARLSHERQTFGDGPSGIAPVCKRCQHRQANRADPVPTIISGPWPPSRTVRHCDAGDHPLAPDAPWWLMRDTTRSWLADTGATCEQHLPAPSRANPESEPTP